VKIALLVKYIGTSFEGFQAQPDGNTVQQHLTDAVSRAVGSSCSVTGCSRTDSGVHALGFVCTTERRDGGEITIPPEKFHKALRPYLHPDIAVIGGARVPEGFHPRYSATGKEYVYVMDDSGVYDPFRRDRALMLRRHLTDSDIAHMNSAAALYEGTHDFSAFMSAGSKITDTVRTVYNASVTRDEGGLVRFTVSADGFLYNMVRIMTGTLIGSLDDTIDVCVALNSGDRSFAGITVPPWGLYLRRVFYDPEIEFLAT